MVAQVRPTTYHRYSSAITAVGSVALIEDINPSLLVHFIGVEWFSDAAGITPAVPTAGEVDVEAFDDTTRQWTPAQRDPIDATHLAHKSSYSANITAMRATPTAVTVATHYRLVVSSNLEGSTSDWLLTASAETSKRGDTALGVYVQDQTTDPVDTIFSETLNTTTIAADALRDTHTVIASPGHGTIIGNRIAVVNSATPTTFYQGRVLNVVGDTLTLDNPINSTYLSGSLLRIQSVSLSVIGTPAAPRIFSVRPVPGQSGDITRVIIEIQDNQSMDFSTFGSIAELTNGCLLRVKKANGDYINLMNWKSNGGFIIRAFDHTFQSKTGGGSHAFTSRTTWAGQGKRGVVLRLDGSLGEELQLLVQDDLTALDAFAAVAQGHLLQHSV